MVNLSIFYDLTSLFICFMYSFVSVRLITHVDDFNKVIKYSFLFYRQFLPMLKLIVICFTCVFCFIIQQNFSFIQVCFVFNNYLHLLVGELRFLSTNTNIISLIFVSTDFFMCYACFLTRYNQRFLHQCYFTLALLEDDFVAFL